MRQHARRPERAHLRCFCVIYSVANVTAQYPILYHSRISVSHVPTYTARSLAQFNRIDIYKYVCIYIYIYEREIERSRCFFLYIYSRNIVIRVYPTADTAVSPSHIPAMTSRAKLTPSVLSQHHVAQRVSPPQITTGLTCPTASAQTAGCLP